MKKALLVLPLVLAIQACSTVKKPEETAVIPSPTPPVTESIKLDTPKKAEIDLPAWYIKVPGSTDEYVFLAGTGFSSSLNMSRSKAMLDAQYQLASKINGIVDAVARQQLRDSDGQTTADYTSIVLRKKILETSVAGHHLEDTVVQRENQGYRTFVLVRYPIGEHNVLLDKKFKKQPQVDPDAEIDKEIGKVLPSVVDVTPVNAVSAPVVAPVQEKAELKLLDVDNEEYKRRRDEVLQQPGAVVGRMTLQ